MNNFLTSSLGKKVIMAVTGLFLITFLIVHCGINALIFYNDGGKNFTAGAEFMGTNPLSGPWKWFCSQVFYCIFTRPLFLP